MSRCAHNDDVWEVLRALFLTVVVAVFARWTVAVGPHSGQSQPPMYGDYEAQRHWMEITYNLPMRQWYFNTSDNDLLYWGLDYPPLTAYHSWILGVVASRVNSSWVSLYSSRGTEHYEHRVFMRLTVLLADLVTMIPTAVVFVWVVQTNNKQATAVKCTVVALHLLYPGYLLIDHGHFQYNCVSVGIALAAILCLHVNHDLLGSVLFVCSLCYKQMQLYLALPFFFYLLGRSVNQPNWFKRIIKLFSIGLVTVAAFASMFAPLLLASDDPLGQLLQILHRLFPFDRGIFEDKVANVWCAMSVVIKFKNYFDKAQLVRMSASACLFVSLPSCVFLFFDCTKRQFRYALCVVSLTFFLFSYQVHEKSILIVAMPVLLIASEHTTSASWFLMCSVISLFPLCVKDAMLLQFFAVAIFYHVFLSDVFGFFMLTTRNKERRTILVWKNVAFHLSVCAGLSLCIASLVVPSPSRYPDLFPVLNSLYSCLHFVIFLCVFYVFQFSDFQHDMRPKKKMKTK